MGLEPGQAHRAIDAAFDEIAHIHRLMSFHDSKSDLSRLNRSRPGVCLRLHPYTHEVLEHALDFSAESGGCFDVTVGAELVRCGLLPACAHNEGPGSWRDIELLSGYRVVLHRSVCLDLGGIAKGFAVDRATDCLRRHGALQTVVNAGGDIRVQGREVEPIRLSAESSRNSMPVLELADGSVASSSGHLRRLGHSNQDCGPHWNGIHRSPAPTDRFVCVVARRCMTADALTKVVMALGAESASILRRFNASAYLHDPHAEWQTIEAERAMAG